MSTFVSRALRLVLSLTVLAGPVAACGQKSSVAAATERLLILSKNEQLLSIVDPATLKIVGRVPAGPDPHEVVASTDGTRAYISNYGGGTYNTLTIIDLVNQKSLGTVDLGALRGPHGLHFVGGRVWFTSEVAKAIGSYDPSTGKVDLILGSGQDGTHMLYVFPDQSRVVTTNIGSGTVTFFEKRAGPRPDWTAAVFPAGARVEGFDVSPDGKQVWAASAGLGNIMITDVASKTQTALAAGVQGANRLKFTPDGTLVLVTTLGNRPGPAGENLNKPNLTIIRTSDRQLVQRIDVGTGAAGIEIQPDGSRAFVACSPDNYVAVIDLKTMQVVGKIDAGRNPDGLAWAVTRR
jgi:YVTN family beta-propeller protein